MIVGRIENLKTDARWLPAAVRQGLEYLAKTDLSKLAAGRHEITKDQMFVLLQDYSTVPKSEKRPEAHDRFLDIQYVVSGEEILGYAVRDKNLPVGEDLLVDKDIIFFKQVNDETDVILAAGMYVVVFPEDVHRPGCVYRNVTPVRKAVVKVALSLL